MHIYDMWQNVGMRPPRNEAVLQEIPQHHVRSDIPQFLFLPVSACRLLSLCIWSCPRINPSIYSRSLPMLLLSVCYWKSEQWALHFQYTALSWRLWENDAGRQNRRGRKSHWQAGKQQSAPVPLSLHCLRALDVSKRQESGEREDREQMSRGFVRPAGFITRWKSRERGTRDGDGGESTGMTSPQDLLHPLPLYCKQRQESLPPSPLCNIYIWAVITYGANADGRDFPVLHTHTHTHTLFPTSTPSVD